MSISHDCLLPSWDPGPLVDTIYVVVSPCLFIFCAYLYLYVHIYIVHKSEQNTIVINTIKESNFLIGFCFKIWVSDPDGRLRGGREHFKPNLPHRRPINQSVSVGNCRETEFKETNQNHIKTICYDEKVKTSVIVFFRSSFCVLNKIE